MRPAPAHTLPLSVAPLPAETRESPPEHLERKREQEPPLSPVQGEAPSRRNAGPLPRWNRIQPGLNKEHGPVHIVQGKPARGRSQHAPKIGRSRLANHDRNSYLKGEPRFLRLTETGAGTARFAPRARLPAFGQCFTTPAHRE